MTDDSAHRAIDAVWRIESAKLIAGLTRIVRDVGLAEDLAQDALAAALEQWPKAGVPDNPGAWLMGTAKHRAIDIMRSRTLHDRKHQELGRTIDADQQHPADALDDAIDDHIGDDMLRLVFTTCHPSLSTEAKLALTLRLLGGLTTEEIARAFLQPTATIAQRIVRAKRTLAESEIPFEVPRGAELEERVSSVLEVIYLIFNEGYSATSGDDWMRPELCNDALRLGRILAGLVPQMSEVQALVALMEIQASRTAARVNSKGEPILLLSQDRTKWNHLQIQRGLVALDRAERRAREVGPYFLQAAIAACHARAAVAEVTDWEMVAALYAQLALRTPSPIVELNRGVAIAMAYGPAAGLAHVDQLQNEPSLKNYHLLPSVRADFLFKLERYDEARVELERAASLTQNSRERELLLGRAAECRKLAVQPR